MKKPTLFFAKILNFSVVQAECLEQKPLQTQTCERDARRKDKNLHWPWQQAEYEAALTLLADAGRMTALLGHPLRQGAIQALVARRDPAPLRDLDAARAARINSQDATDTVFRHAAYRA